MFRIVSFIAVSILFLVPLLSPVHAVDHDKAEVIADVEKKVDITAVEKSDGKKKEDTTEAEQSEEAKKADDGDEEPDCD